MRTCGESQVWTTAATETCSSVDALLLQALVGGAIGRKALLVLLAPSKEPQSQLAGRAACLLGGGTGAARLGVSLRQLVHPTFVHGP
jgi:hypothetical protein